jgi:O-acetyl-ADP-ribose deacetylase (regulator of RNase III)
MAETTRVQVNNTILELIQGNIVLQDTQAIVNAANTSLLGGGGVDGAIHRAAGPGLLDECRMLNGCKTGDAKITKGYSLKAKYVIHAVGPFYNPNRKDAAELLASAYRRSLEIAVENGIQSISFPAISTGAYRYPLAQAAPIALKTVMDFVQREASLSLVRFVLFTEPILSAFSSALHQLLSSSNLIR